MDRVLRDVRRVKSIGISIKDLNRQITCANKIVDQKIHNLL